MRLLFGVFTESDDLGQLNPCRVDSVADHVHEDEADPEVCDPVAARASDLARDHLVPNPE